MKIQKDQIQVNDEVVLTLGKSEAKGPVTRRQTNNAGEVVAVWLPAFEKSFWLSPEAVNVEEWGRPVWTVASAERPEVARGVVITAETDGGSRRRVFGTAGVEVDGYSYPYVDEHGNLLNAAELRNIEVEPDWKAAVDVYARTHHELRAYLDGARMSPRAREQVNKLLDRALDVKAAAPAGPVIKFSDLSKTITEFGAKEPFYAVEDLVANVAFFLSSQGVQVNKP